jgi:hypothetical protein
MAGTFNIKQLGNGQLPSTEGTLYTVPASTTTIIKTIIVTNRDGSDRTFTLYVQTSTSRAITPVSMTLKTGESFHFNEPLTLQATHLIRGIASVATQLDYTISGVEET